MCPKEDIDCQCSKMQEVTSGLESKLAALEEKLHVASDIKSQCTKLQETLDAVLLKLGEKKDGEWMSERSKEKEKVCI